MKTNLKAALKAIKKVKKKPRTYTKTTRNDVDILALIEDIKKTLKEECSDQCLDDSDDVNRVIVSLMKTINKNYIYAKKYD